MLDVALRELDLLTNNLAAPASVPPAETPVREWTDRGEWLVLAHRLKAAGVYFVGNDPVLLFHEVPSLDDATLRSAYRRAWSMSRPRFLFVASPTELRVYGLSQPPARTPEEWSRIAPLAAVTRAADVAQALKEFHRDRIESGQLLYEAGRPQDRADQRLIADLSYVRRALLERGLDVKHVHALIGRSIFIRYLEDRRVLTRQYFQEIAEQRPVWQKILQEDHGPTDLTRTGTRFYDRVLRSKGFTYALFEKLAEDFHGDMFPSDSSERGAVDARDLTLLQALLLGDVHHNAQASLFFWAYDFSVVPTELISSIYEQFYHDTTEDSHGTHYTRIRVVEDVLSRTLTLETLEKNPRVLDPSCGSGVFLVEAYKRIIRHATAKKGARLTPGELRAILRDQIAGIEINSEAARIAAFSLYLALLDFQDPPSILARRRLPRLLHAGPNDDYGENYGIIAVGNAFAPTPDERERFSPRGVTPLPFSRGSFDVVVGNPPWEQVPPAPSGNGSRSKLPGEIALHWAQVYELPVGDKGYSQLFLHRALTLLKDGGRLGMLLHASVLFNQRHTSKEFRYFLLTHVSLQEVVNYSHVRTLAFTRAIAPFIYLGAEATRPRLAHDRFIYATARHTQLADVTGLGVIGPADRRTVAQVDALERDYLWKTYSWGNHRDAALMQALDSERRLRDVVGDVERATGYGFQNGKGATPETLRSIPILSSSDLLWYGPLTPDNFEPPPRGVNRTPTESLYVGQRLLAVRAVKGDFGLCIRLESEPLAFRHTIYSIKLDGLAAWQAKVIVGTFWSALGRYRMFMRAAAWGTWYDQFNAEDWLDFPVRIPSEQSALTGRIVDAVDEIRASSEPTLTGERQPRQPSRATMDALNASVADLFDLTEPEHELVLDWERTTYDLFRNRANAVATQPIRPSPEVAGGKLLPAEQIEAGPLTSYLRALASSFRSVLDSPADFRWDLYKSTDASFVAVVVRRGHASMGLPAAEWASVLQRCTEALGRESTSSLYIDGLLRVILPDSVVIAKRNEQRLWTATMAREDSDAVLAKVLMESDR